MEWIGIGILLAIGFYLAPMIVMLVLSIVAIVISIITAPFVWIADLFRGR